MEVESDYGIKRENNLFEMKDYNDRNKDERVKKNSLLYSFHSSNP